MPVVPSAARRALAAVAAILVLLGSLTSVVASSMESAGSLLIEPAEAPGAEEPDGHLVISELVTGGTTASDEMIELYNPNAVALPLEGLELIYVTASGATITRKASWAAGAPSIPAGAHLLVANEAGIYATLGDATYVNGLAATGGSLALRVIGASTAVDAVGWGTAANPWLEGTPAPAPATGHSLERLPGGSAGSGQDTDQNNIDFVERTTPDPQNSASPPIPIATPTPAASPSMGATQTPEASVGSTPTPSATSSPSVPPVPSPSTTPSASVSPTPTPVPIVAIADARAMPDGSIVTIEGVSLTASTFNDGGGFVSDATGGIAVLVGEGTYERGSQLRVTGEIDDRYHQRTVRAAAGDIVVLGVGADPSPISVATGAVDETVEGRLIHLVGVIDGSPTTLSGALAFDVDDGSGAARVVVQDASGIDTTGWVDGAGVDLRAVVGQRDSSGTGTEGYRAMPRDAADVLGILPPATPSPTPTPSPSPSPSDDPGEGVSSIADARDAAVGTRLRVRGIVTLPSDLHEAGSAVIQDATGGILLRLGDEAGTLARGTLVEIDGRRSTKAGMESILVSAPARTIGTRAEPKPARRATGAVGEGEEALLVVVRGSIVTSVLRSSAENVYFSIDDGSGPLRIFLSPRAGIPSGRLALGVWVEITGVVTQETTGQQPQRGYRVWPRADADLAILPAPAGTQRSGATQGGSKDTIPNLDSGASGIAGGLLGSGLQAPTNGRAEAPSLGAARGGRAGIAQPMPTFSPGPVSTSARIGPAAGGEPVPGPLGGLLVLLGGLGMGGSAFLLAPPGLTERLWALAHGDGPSTADDGGDVVGRASEAEGSALEALRLDVVSPGMHADLRAGDGAGAGMGARVGADLGAGLEAEDARNGPHLRLVATDETSSEEVATLRDGRILPPT